jgi:SAM-dependent methyltransferase
MRSPRESPASSERMDTDLKEHWQQVHQTKSPTQTSWYQRVPERSLDLIQAAGLPPVAPVLDVGGGASTLVDHLLAAAFTDVTVLDIAPAGLATARARLGDMAARIECIVADITSWQPARRYRVWHDRAVFHFLIDPLLRTRYVCTLRSALTPGGHVVMATFGPDGPARCSGLAVCRYSADELSAALGPSFRLVRSQFETHITPTGGTQQFLYGWWQAEA